MGRGQRSAAFAVAAMCVLPLASAVAQPSAPATRPADADRATAAEPRSTVRHSTTTASAWRWRDAWGPLPERRAPDAAGDEVVLAAAPTTASATDAAAARNGATTAGLPGAAQTIPAVVLEAYQRAAAQLAVTDPTCRLRWQVLAGVGRIESGHARNGQVDASGRAGRIIGPVLDGRPGVAAIQDSDGGRYDDDTVWDHAVGPMQFLPGTWRSSGADGDGDGVADPHNMSDAALAAGGYLCAGDADLGTPMGLARALLRYNRSTAYVASVMRWIAAYDGEGAAPSTAVPGVPRPGGSAAPVPGVPGTATPMPVPMGTPTPDPTGTPTPDPTGTPTPDPTGTPTPDPTGTPTPDPTGTPTPDPTGTPTPDPTGTPTPDPTGTPTPDPTGTPTPDPTGTPTPDPTGTPTPDETGTPTPDPTGTPTPDETGTPTPDPTGTSNPTPDVTEPAPTTEAAPAAPTGDPAPTATGG